MRASGILMHITSLPGACGIGTMGKHAYAFVDFLKKAGQSYWQILPLTPTGYGNSPYQSASTFAGNHYLIDLEMLVDQGFLLPGEIADITWCESEEKVDFGLLYQHRLKVLNLAYNRFADEAALDAFCRENSSWLPDFALFMALKEQFGGKPWYEWPEALKHRDPDAIWNARKENRERIRFFCFVQYIFSLQWNALRAYAHENGIHIIGDVPIYVPLDSADVWSEPELFQLDEKLQPVAVAGCPPDGFSEDGQLWGNPLYRWEKHAADGFEWWLRRLGAAGNWYDVVRLDHFRGFEAYWSVPYGDKTAKNGKWIKGPGMKFIQAVKNALPEIAFIAEDLGFLTQEVLDMRDASGYPGMKVLEFAFYSAEPLDYAPHNHVRNAVCYIGTHDNVTARQWFEEIDDVTLEYASSYMALNREEGQVWGMIRTAMSSVCDLSILQLQDCLELGSEARMNSPGLLTDANWTWRVKPGYDRQELAEKLYGLTRRYGRLGN